MVSAAIIGVGILVLLAVLLLRDGDRERSARSLRVGDDSTSVAARMKGSPEHCPGNDLGHLANAFPANTPRPTIEETLGSLSGRTATRWVYSDDERANACRPRAGETEVGFAANGRVLWVVPVHGTTPITM